MSNTSFSCCPVKASETNPDGTPALINECPLDEARWIGIYRHNPDHEDTDKMPSDWVFDIPVEPADHDRALKIAQGLVDLLNGISAQDALHNPNFHVYFE
jgi:hypothetical protein